jgi:hypothetical protein
MQYLPHFAKLAQPIPGIASSFIQLAMAIIVYGASGLAIGAGLIGAARQRLR